MTPDFDPRKIQKEILLRLSELGELAWEDKVELAKLGSTIIKGGYLNTELIKAKSIVADQLNVDDLAAITAKFSGNVYVGGDLLVGGQGVLSVFKFESTGGSSYGPFDLCGWGNIGILDGVFGGSGVIQVFVPIPANFMVTKAILHLYAMPVYCEDATAPVPKKWKQSRRLKLYCDTSSNDGFWHCVEFSETSEVVWRGATDVTSAVFGVSTWDPPLAYSGSDFNNTQNKIQVRSGDIKSYLTPGQNTTFFVKTTESLPTSFNDNQGLGKIVVIVEGYLKPAGME